MDRERLDEWCEQGILFLVIAMLWTGPILAGAFRLSDLLILRTLTIVILSLWILRLVLNPQKRLLWPPICWLIVAFCGYAAMAYRWAPIEFVARQEFLKILMYSLVFLAVINNLNGQDSTQKVLFSLLILGGCLGLYALIQFLTGTQKVMFDYKLPVYAKRATGTFYNPNLLGGYLEMLLPFSITFLLVGKLKYVTKILIAYLGLLILVGIGVTISRGTWFASIVSVAVLFAILLSKRSYRMPAMLSLVVLCSLIFFFIKNEEHSQKRLRLVVDAKTENVRFELWKPALDMWNEKRMTGVGPGHFDHLFPGFRPVNISARPLYVHNDYLNTLCDWGIIGFVLLLSIFLAFYRMLFTVLPHVQKSESDLGRRTSNKFAIVIGGAASVLAIALHSFVDFNLQLASHALLLVVIAALIAGYSRFATEQFWIKPSLFGQILVGITLLISTTYLSLETWKSGQQALAFSRAQKELKSWPKRLELMKNAFQSDPRNPEIAYYLGESLRLKSFEGLEDFMAYGKQAEQVFTQGIAANPLDPLMYVKLGMTTDWINEDPEKKKQSNPLFAKAFELDRFNYLISAFYGWHAFQLEDYSSARFWMQTSLNLENSQKNSLAHSYAPIIKERIQEAVGKLNRASTHNP